MMILYGREAVKSGEYICKNYQNDDFDLAIAISAGVRLSLHPSIDANEDVVGINMNNDNLLAVLADGHRGKRSAEMVVEHMVERIPSVIPESETEFISWLENSLFEVSAIIAEQNKKISDRRQSRTTVVLALCDNTQLYLASFGDSRIYATWDKAIQLNPTANNRFIGFPMEKAAFLGNIWVEKCEWRNGLLLLLSDGFPEIRVPEIAPDEIISWLDPGSTSCEKAKNMMHKAIQKKAIDNLSCIVIQKS